MAGGRVGKVGWGRGCCATWAVHWPQTTGSTSGSVTPTGSMAGGGTWRATEAVDLGEMFTLDCPELGPNNINKTGSEPTDLTISTVTGGCGSGDYRFTVNNLTGASEVALFVSPVTFTGDAWVPSTITDDGGVIYILGDTDSQDVSLIPGFFGDGNQFWFYFNVTGDNPSADITLCCV